MSRQRFVLLLLAALAAISIALFLNARRNQNPAADGAALFPGLASHLNSVTSVVLRKDGPTPSVTLHKSGDVWTVAERADYPADLGKLRKLLLSLGDAKIIEEKTADPQLFAAIGVEDPGAKGAGGIEVTVTAGPDKLALIVGKSVGEGNFVRRPGENRSYSVEPGITADAEPRYWVDPHLLDVSSSQIQELDVKPATGTAYVLRRAKPAESAKPPAADLKPPTGTAPAPSAAPDASTAPSAAPAASAAAPVDDNFRLDGVPAGRKALDGAALRPSPSMLSTLDAEDVAAASSIDFGQSSQAVITLADGTQLTLTGTVIDNKHWIQVASAKNAALTAKTTGRAFEIAGYRYDGIFKPVDQWLVPKEPPPSKTPPAMKSAAAPRLPSSPKPPSHASPASAPATPP